MDNKAKQNSLFPQNSLFLLGGSDAEMVTIAKVLSEFDWNLVDKKMKWGAKASHYESEIRAALNDSRHPVLIELEQDLDSKLLKKCLIIDHHNDENSGQLQSSLQQVLELIGKSAQFAQNRRWQLIAANDIGHIQGMRRLSPPGTDEEIAEIRLFDLHCQGVTDQEIEIAKSDIANNRTLYKDWTVVMASNDRTSLIAEYLDPFYDGPSAENVLVMGKSEVGFFGKGQLVRRLASHSPPGKCWFGGSLPERGFWGIAKANLDFDPKTVLNQSPS